MMVAICGKEGLFREALATVVTRRGHDVVCCVGVLAEAVRAIECSSADVLLLDASLADGHSSARLAARRQRGPALRVLLLTTSAEDISNAAAALEAGLADGVLHHAAALATLERALSGQPSPALRPRRTVARPQRDDSVLTGREREVIGLLLAGRSSEAIASALGVTRNTVHSHVQSILRKLGAQSRIEAVSIYLGETTPHNRSVLWS